MVCLAHAHLQQLLQQATSTSAEMKRIVWVVFFLMLAMHNYQCFSWHCLLNMSLLTQRTLEWCAGNLARLSIKPREIQLWVSLWWEAKHGSAKEAESSLTENNWWNNELKLSKMEKWFRGGDYRSQRRLKMSKRLGRNTWLMLARACAIHWSSCPDKHNQSNNGWETWYDVKLTSQSSKEATPAKPSKSTQNFQYFANWLDFQNRKEPLNEFGDLPKWLVEQTDLLAASKIYLAGGNVLPWREDEGGMTAMASPGSRWPKTEGDGCTHFISSLYSIRQSKAQVQTKATICKFAKVCCSLHSVLCCLYDNRSLWRIVVHNFEYCACCCCLLGEETQGALQSHVGGN